MARSLSDKYFQKYGIINCVNIQRQVYDRFFHLEDTDGFNKLDEAGGHSNPEKYPRIVGTAARWAMEVLLDYGAIALG